MRRSAEARAAALLLLLAACGAALSQSVPQSVPSNTDDPAPIRVLLAAALETTLSSQMNGSLGELRAAFGQQVEKGAVLVKLSCAETQARAKVAEAERTIAQQNLQTKRELRKLDAVGDIEVAVAAGEYDKAEGNTELVRALTGYCQVTAPFAGRIAKVHVKPFQTVSAGTPLFDLVSSAALRVRLNVPSAMLTRLQPGAALAVQIHETGKTYPAQVTAVSSRVDAVAQTVELEARLTAVHPELSAGMSGVARFPQRP